MASSIRCAQYGTTEVVRPSQGSSTLLERLLIASVLPSLFAHVAALYTGLSVHYTQYHANRLIFPVIPFLFVPELLRLWLYDLPIKHFFWIFVITFLGLSTGLLMGHDVAAVITDAALLILGLLMLAILAPAVATLGHLRGRSTYFAVGILFAIAALELASAPEQRAWYFIAPFVLLGMQSRHWGLKAATLVAATLCAFATQRLTVLLEILGCLLTLVRAKTLIKTMFVLTGLSVAVLGLWSSDVLDKLLSTLSSTAPGLAIRISALIDILENLTNGIDSLFAVAYATFGSVGQRIYEFEQVLDSLSGSVWSAIFGFGFGATISVAGAPNIDFILSTGNPVERTVVHLAIGWYLLKLGLVGAVWWSLTGVLVVRRVVVVGRNVSSSPALRALAVSGLIGFIMSNLTWSVYGRNSIFWLGMWVGLLLRSGRRGSYITERTRIERRNS